MLPQVPPGGSSRRAAVSATGLNTAEPAGGAGRIQSLRAFRRAGLIDAMVRCCNAARVLWLDGSMARWLEPHKEKTERSLSESWHNKFV